jgi:hypothetical protein
MSMIDLIDIDDQASLWRVLAVFDDQGIPIDCRPLTLMSDDRSSLNSRPSASWGSHSTLASGERLHKWLWLSLRSIQTPSR